QYVGHARRRRHSRCGAGGGCPDRPGMATSRRASRVPRYPGCAAARLLSKGVGMSRVAHASRSSRIGVALTIATLIILALAPFWGDRQTLRLLAEVYAFIALASLWNLLAGYAGLVSVGQQAFVGLGGYLLFASAILLGIH